MAKLSPIRIADAARGLGYDLDVLPPDVRAKVWDAQLDMRVSTVCSARDGEVPVVVTLAPNAAARALGF